MKYVLLRSIEFGTSFFTLHTKGSDETKLSDGTVAYEIIGYAETVAEAQTKLYGRSFTNSTD